LHDCNCITQAGTMDPAPLIVCGDTPVTALHQQDQFLAPGAILLFVLHQGSGSNLANPIAWNTVPTFAFTGGVVYGKQYYISAIAGTQNGPGSIDLNNACLSVAPGTPVTFVQQVFSAVSAAICIGEAYTLGDTIVQAPGMYTRVLMGNNGCDSTVQLTLSVRIPDVTLGPDATICLGDSLLLIAKKTGCMGCSIQWSVPGDKDTILVKPNTQAIYSVEIQDNIGCRAQDDITINVGIPVSVDLDVVVCDSMPWYVGGKPYTEPGFYEIPLLSAAGCDSTVNLTLEFADPKTYAALDDTLFYPPGLGLSERTFSLVQNDLLPVGGAWLTTLLDAPQAGTAILAPGGTLVYRLTNTAFLGVDSFTYQLCDTFCTGPCDTGRVVLVVQDGLVEAAEEMPNAFSPNDDEFNPTFDPLFYFKDKKFIVPNGRVSMTILNRWGEIVWHADDYPNGGWDGKSGTGKLVPQGTYYYMLRMALGETIILKGAVTVFR
jgi:gliding motility-associated-like protein